MPVGDAAAYPYFAVSPLRLFNIKQIAANKLKRASPAATFLHPSVIPGEHFLDLGGEPLWLLKAPKHSQTDVVIVFRGVAMTGDIELDTSLAEACAIWSIELCGFIKKDGLVFASLDLCGFVVFFPRGNWDDIGQQLLVPYYPGGRAIVSETCCACHPQPVNDYALPKPLTGFSGINPGTIAH
jgi:hypothetical protein